MNNGVVPVYFRQQMKNYCREIIINQRLPLDEPTLAYIENLENECFNKFRMDPGSYQRNLVRGIQHFYERRVQAYHEAHQRAALQQATARQPSPLSAVAPSAPQPQPQLQPQPQPAPQPSQSSASALSQPAAPTPGPAPQNPPASQEAPPSTSAPDLPQPLGPEEAARLREAVERARGSWKEVLYVASKTLDRSLRTKLLELRKGGVPFEGSQLPDISQVLEPLRPLVREMHPIVRELHTCKHAKEVIYLRDYSAPALRDYEDLRALEAGHRERFTAYAEAFKRQQPQAYEKLLEDMEGDEEFFTKSRPKPDGPAGAVASASPSPPPAPPAQGPGDESDDDTVYENRIEACEDEGSLDLAEPERVREGLALLRGSKYVSRDAERKKAGPRLAKLFGSFWPCTLAPEPTAPEANSKQGKGEGKDKAKGKGKDKDKAKGKAKGKGADKAAEDKVKPKPKPKPKPQEKTKGRSNLKRRKGLGLGIFKGVLSANLQRTVSASMGVELSAWLEGAWNSEWCRVE